LKVRLLQLSLQVQLANPYGRTALVPTGSHLLLLHAVALNQLHQLCLFTIQPGIVQYTGLLLLLLLLKPPLLAAPSRMHPMPRNPLPQGPPRATHCALQVHA
jgi:hypothetical protein